MAYTECIKNFERIRDYVREFYVYGFKTREEYNKKSSRSYDNEKRRMESYLSDYMGARYTTMGKRVFLSIDSREGVSNPLYRIWKAKSFTNADITLYFILLDILYQKDIAYTVQQITEKIDTEYLQCFETPMVLDISTIRKKLKEYVVLGLLTEQKDGRQIRYARTADFDISDWKEAICFFAEADICGVIGSYIADTIEDMPKGYIFKHHHITHTLESDVICILLQAIQQKRIVCLQSVYRQKKEWRKVLPLRIFISVQNGRSYLMAYDFKYKRIQSFRLDYVGMVEIKEVSPLFAECIETLESMQKHMWGVCCSKRKHMERVSFTIQCRKDENYIVQRLQREKRCGTVECVKEGVYRFTAEVYDTSEMIPWIRSFICRIVSLEFSNRSLENQFWKDVQEMYDMYNLEDAKEQAT